MISIRLLFWNMGRAATPSLLAALIADEAPDIVVLIESEHGIAATVEEVSSHSGLLYDVPLNYSDRFQFLVRMPPERMQPLEDGPNMAIRHVRPVLGQSFILAACPWPSKLHASEKDQELLCTRWASRIRVAEVTVNHHRTIVIGDLNMNPFDRPEEVFCNSEEEFTATIGRILGSQRIKTVVASLIAQSKAVKP